MFEKIFILPVIEIAKSIYLSIFFITHDYGISLIILSLFSVFLMALLLKFLNRFAERETQIQKVLSPQLLRIRKESKGQERYNRVVKLYSRYNYHPILAVRSLVPVLVQLPFLFTAYLMLNNLEYLHNQSFLFIKDLSAPDSLLWGINILPVLMTIINISTAFISKKFSTREKIQASVIAVLFFVLLYNKSSALLIFWTTNNLILLIRTIIRQLFENITIFPVLSEIVKRILNFLKSNPLYPFIIGVYPVIYLFSYNIADTAFPDTIIPFFINLFLTIILYCIVYLLFRNKFKAALFSAISMILMFYYKYSLHKIGAVIKIPGYILFGIWIFLLTVVFIVLNHFDNKKNILKRINTLMNYITLLITSVLFINIISYQFTIALQVNDAVVNTISGGNLQSETESNAMPDIYYIILDGYGSNSCLSDFYNFDNSAFTDELIRRGFYLSFNSKSNYSTTFLSLCSSLNMEYIQDLDLDLDENSRNRERIYYLIENNQVIRFLKDKGYRYIHFQTGWGAGNKNADITYFSRSGEFIILWINMSVFSPIIRKLGITDYLRDSKLNTFTQLSKVKEIKGSKFIFCHIVLPHPPYLFGADGEKVNDSDVSFTGFSWQRKDKYINQLKFTNKKVIELLDNIFNDQSYAPVIILQADHGTASTLGGTGPPAFKYWRNPAPESIIERMSILNAYYIPGKDYSSFYNTISPVNSFRILFNTIFNSKYPVLQDKMYFSSYENPYKFR